MNLSSVLYDYLRTTILPLKEIDNATPKSGTVCDLGCGQGVIATYLAKNKKRKVIGIDKNVKRLRSSPDSSNLLFQNGDITKIELSNPDAVIISDVLHHLTYKDQKQILKNVAKNLKKGGVLIVKEIDTKEFIRSYLSRFWDFIFYPKDKIYYRNSQNFKKYLQSQGFKVRITRPCRLFPGSTTLYICQRV